jgi:hypothetical protein
MASHPLGETPNGLLEFIFRGDGHMDYINKISQRSSCRNGLRNSDDNPQTGPNISESKILGISDIHILHTVNQTRFAETFIEIALRQYDAGDVSAGDQALKTANEAFAHVKQLVNELDSEHRALLLRDLEALERAFAKLSAARER